MSAFNQNPVFIWDRKDSLNYSLVGNVVQGDNLNIQILNLPTETGTLDWVIKTEIGGLTIQGQNDISYTDSSITLVIGLPLDTTEYNVGSSFIFQAQIGSNSGVEVKFYVYANNLSGTAEPLAIAQPVKSLQIDQSGGTNDTFGILTGAINGVNTTYTVSQASYTSGQLTVYLNGQLQIQGSNEDWIETDPLSGTFDFNIAPETGDLITVEYDRTTISTNGIKYIRSKSDLPTAINNIITLSAGAYMLTGHVDLTGDYLVFNGDSVLFGTSSETCSLTSTGLTGNALINSVYDLPIRNLEINNVDQAVDLIATDNTKALDWNAVNFVDVAYVGRIKNYSNFIQTFSAYINSGKIRFEGTIGTVAFDSTLFSLPLDSAIEFADDFISTRRIRFVFCPFVVLSGKIGIDLPATASVQTEAFIISDCNFSGGGTYLNDINHTSNLSLFKGNKGIINTSVNGQMYMQSNVTATTITNTTNFYKVAGTTTASSDNQKYTHTNNRLTNAATISRKFLIQASLSFTAGNNNVCEFGFYDSELGTIRTPSRTLATANSAGRAENVSLFCVVEHNTGDYIEIHARNTSAITNITVTDLNVLINEIN